MKPNKTNREPILTPVFRASFPHVFTPQKPMKAGDVPQYTLAMIFEGAQADKKIIQKLVDEAVATATVAWGPDRAKWPTNIQWPFQKGETKASYPAGSVFINTKNKKKPAVVDQNVEPIVEEGRFFGGVYALAKVQAYAWEYMGKHGISFSLGNVQLVRDGEPFGTGSSKPEDDFDSIAMPGASEGESGPVPVAAAAGGVDLGI